MQENTHKVAVGVNAHAPFDFQKIRFPEIRIPGQAAAMDDLNS